MQQLDNVMNAVIKITPIIRYGAQDNAHTHAILRIHQTLGVTSISTIYTGHSLIRILFI